MAKKLSNNKKRRLTALADQAMQLAGQGQIAAARSLCDQADAISPDTPNILYARGISYAAQQDYESAADWFGRACDAEPRRVEFLVNHAGCLRVLGKEAEAFERYGMAIKLAPKVAQVAFGYSSSCAALGEYRKAIEVLETAIKANPRHIELLRKLAAIHNELAENATALSLLERALSLAPGHAEILYDMGTYLVQNGELEAARTCFRQALSNSPGYTPALSMLVSSGEYNQRGEDISLLQHHYQQSDPTSEQHTVAAFALGNIADETGQYEQAFHYWSEGNRQRAAQLQFAEAEQSRLHALITNHFPASAFSAPVTQQASDCAPVFIVGMPRSGTTLLEQALSRHPELQAAGEMYAMEQSIVGRMQQTSVEAICKHIESGNDHHRIEIGQEYSRRLREEYRLPGRVIDKALNNYLYAGIIARGLPAARIIHVRREPRASCLSMFQQDFVNTIAYSFDLKAMGRQYARYLALMQYWRDVLPDGVLLEVNYEDMVAEPEQELRRLLDGCGLEWDEACLQSHHATGMVATSSRFQVRKPMHQQSVARWQHYEKWLQPFVAAMESVTDTDN